MELVNPLRYTKVGILAAAVEYDPDEVRDLRQTSSILRPAKTCNKINKQVEEKTVDDMINTTIFKSAFILLVMVSSAITHPLDSEVDIQSSKPPAEETLGDHYDQRQNGTKNFRLHIDGVFVVVAPAEALLLAGELDPASLGLLTQESPSGPSKPGSPSSAAKEKPSSIPEGNEPVKQKSSHGHGFRLKNLLGPLLRRFSP